MTLAVQSSKITSLNQMTSQQVDLLKRTICKGATNEELELFIHTCDHLKLDPFLKQIYAVKRNGKSGEVMTIQTSIDGYRLLADRTGKYMPGRAPTFEYDEKKQIVSATAYVFKLGPDNKWHEVSATAFWKEYVVEYNGKPNNFWTRMPHAMLSKCAESLVLRKAFPSEMSGIRTDEEMQQSDIEITDIPVIHEEESQKEKVENISNLQCEEIESYLFDKIDYRKKILDYYNVSNFMDIPAEKYSFILEKVKKKCNELHELKSLKPSNSEPFFELQKE